MTLTDKIKSMEPEIVNGFSGFVDREEYERMRDIAVILSEACEFYKDIAMKGNHQFIFDDEESSRAKVYEKYKEHSIGDIGMKAYEALAAAEKVLGTGV